MNPDEEDDRTVVRPTGAGGSTVRVTQATQATPRADVPPTASTSQHTHTLPTGTRLGEFELTQTLGEGGFGIVYLAWDHSLDRKVALKEYMPSAIALRVGSTQIRARSDRHQETFEAGMKSFINEAKLLAQFDHPALVKVYRFWEANGTAYMVMPFYEGVTVRDAVRGLAQPPDEAWILALLDPLFHALSMLHASQCFHRDIAPDNIMLLGEKGRPLLLDFGAARRVIGDMTQALTAILKPGYAPVEQYAEVPGLKQGPWTDVYALAAVVHWIITGKTPPASVGRMFGDSYVPLAERVAGRYSPHFLEAIDRALAVLPDKRTQTIEALRLDMTTSGGAAGTSMPLPGPTVRVDAALRQPTLPPPATGDTRWPATIEATPNTGGPRTVAPSPATAAQATSGSRRWPLLAGVGGVLVVAAAAAALWSSRTPPAVVSQPTSPVVQPTVTSPPPATQTLPPVQDVAPAVRDGTPPVREATPPVAVVETPASAAVAPPASTEPRAAARKPPLQKPERRTDPPPIEPRAVEPRSAEPRVAEPRGGADREAECARLFARLSIGESNQELIDRVKTLRCR
jgi:serine/threonine protein kinase